MNDFFEIRREYKDILKIFKTTCIIIKITNPQRVVVGFINIDATIHLFENLVIVNAKVR